MAEQEQFYDAYKNEDNELMFAVRYREKEPENPKIMYDGKEHALFYRTNEDAVVLDYIHPEVCEVLSSVDSVLIVESSENDIEREYFVPVKHVEVLPKSALNLQEPEEE